MKHRISFIFLFFIHIFHSAAKENPAFLKSSDTFWVDSLMSKLTLDQKIGQLFMVQAYSNEKNGQTETILKQIEKFEVGGIIFMQGGPVAQAKISNRFQLASNIPLLVAIDAETGLGFRLDSTINYPVQMALGAMKSDSLIYQMGYEIGKQCRLTGIHMNMAPVSDINTNPDNPVINFRSFGEDKQKVAQRSWLYAQGMQDAGIIAVAKHFPGHGDTHVDSHLGLPVISKTKLELDSTELYPFSYLIKKGIAAVMTAHLQVSTLESNAKLPATLSAKIINTKLKGEMGFNGLIITDAMNMKGVSNMYSSAESSVKALKAGNDMIEIVPRLDKAIEAVKKAVQSGELTTAEIDAKCRKILLVKKWLGLDKQKLVATENLVQELNRNSYKLTKRKLIEQSLTVLKNDQNKVPLLELGNLKTASLVIGADSVGPFQKMLSNYAEIDHFTLGSSATDEAIDNILNQLKPYKQLIVGIQGMKLYPTRQFGITSQQLKAVEKLDKKQAIAVFFGNPYALNTFQTITDFSTLILTYYDDKEVQELAAQLIYGATEASGKIPVTISNLFPVNSGIETKSLNRLKFTIPEEAGINSGYLRAKIDSLALLGINQKAFPGCQVLVAKDGKVIFNNSYGYFTYEKEQAVTPESIFDLASVTKITTALPAIMKLYDEKSIQLDTPFSTYFAEFKKSNKAELTLRDILTHQARLQSGLPFWLEPGKPALLRKDMFQDQPSEKYTIRVANHLYARNDFREVMIADIIKSPLRTVKEYNYSDLGFCLFPTMIERLTKLSFQEYLNQEFFKPMGATSLTFNPYERFPLSQIVPTENDEKFRKEQIQGFVHDEAAALMGGVSGNAGLFGNTTDLAKMMQMYLQNGYYGGKQYIQPGTVNEFTKVQFPSSSNKRALGFDKPNPGTSGKKNKFPAADASPLSFGHTGFTGIFAWADPQNQTVFIFLSNRVYPTRRNTTIYNLNIRTEMQQVIYDALKRGLK